MNESMSPTPRSRWRGTGLIGFAVCLVLATALAVVTPDAEDKGRERFETAVSLGAWGEADGIRVRASGVRVAKQVVIDPEDDNGTVTTASGVAVVLELEREWPGLEQQRMELSLTDGRREFSVEGREESADDLAGHGLRQRRGLYAVVPLSALPHLRLIAEPDLTEAPVSMPRHAVAIPLGRLDATRAEPSTDLAPTTVELAR